uniref:Uncharacterized protein n=1 Tax=Nelumbo nucifera TaxID=4432 RepID=A0A822Z2C6_NELNU|nr:TPA_asm: hypothetical protein HUJ06_014897 [Nelumbo nucifera]
MTEFLEIWMNEFVSKLGDMVRPQKVSVSVSSQQEKPSSFLKSPPNPIQVEPFHGSTLSEDTICMLMDRFAPC